MYISRQMLGESLCSMSIRELKNLERRLEQGISRIRSKKIAENERVQQQMNLMPGGSDYELMPPQSFDARNYLQVNELQPNHQYSRQDPTALQLV
ncbi:hypothetical protein U1Q18_010446 [Sarracenia purpurea var. burkii]